MERKETLSHVLGQTGRRGRRGRGQVIAPLIALCLVGFFLAGCGSSASSHASSGGSKATTSKAAATSPAESAMTAAKAALAPVSNVDLKLSAIPNLSRFRGKTVLVVPISAAPLATALTALKQALSVAGLKMRVCDGAGVPGTISGCMAQAPSLRVAAVITVAVPYQLVPTAYQKVEAAHIPVLAAYQASDGQASSKTLAFQSDVPIFRRALDISDDYITWKTHAAGKVLFIGVSDSPSSVAISTSGASYLRTSCPSCTVDQENILTAQIDTLPNLVSAYVVRHPSTNYILGMNLDVDGQGIVSGLQSATQSLIPFGGTGTGIEGPQLVAQHKAGFVYLESENFQGWEFTDATLRLLAGLPQVDYPIVGRLFDPTNVKGLTFKPADATSFTWFGRPTYQATFRKAWGVS
jgi:hypothetical protein